MAEYDSDSFVYGTVSMKVRSARPVKMPASVKQKIGSRVVSIDILGRTAQDYALQLDGVVYETAATTLADGRGEIENLDDGEAHALTDGIHNGNYIVDTGSLTWNDSGEDGPLIYRYSMRLLQKQ